MQGLAMFRPASHIHRCKAKHAFMNEQRPDAHDRRAAELAWGRSLAFWQKHL
jgi:carboxymethylenebutenolidase